MKKLLLFALLLALVGGGYYYYRTLKGGPSGSLVAAATAVQTHDMTSFEKYVDVTSVTTHLVDDVAQQSSALTSLLPGWGSVRRSPQVADRSCSGRSLTTSASTARFSSYPCCC